MGYLFGYLTLIDTPNGKQEYTILPYIKIVQIVSSIKVLQKLNKAQNHIILKFVHAPYSFITNSLKGLKPLAKYQRLTLCNTYCISFTS